MRCIVYSWLIIIGILSLFCINALQSECENEQEESLTSIVENHAIKFIFVGGKGGVGKTTTSSSLAIAVAAARSGEVLLISTDPAHSLSDAFQPQQFSSIPTKVDGVDNLSVIEIDPSVFLKDELNAWKGLADEAGFDLMGEVHQFSQWITSIPGIDEATALASVITMLEDGSYSCIILDTAPTGHTLKLLQLPQVLEAGITKIQGWQAKLWDYTMIFQQFMGGNKNDNMGSVRKKLETKLKKYKRRIKKVAKIMKDNSMTTFVPVSIAEFLSISETRRLLSELQKYNIHTSHVVLNQLVDSGFSMEDMKAIDFDQGFDVAIAAKIKKSVQLCVTREAIQQKYVQQLSISNEARCLSLVKVPLLLNEVTGVDALKEFSKLLYTPKPNDTYLIDEL